MIELDTPLKNPFMCKTSILSNQKTSVEIIERMIISARGASIIVGITPSCFTQLIIDETLTMPPNDDIEFFYFKPCI